MSTSLRVRRSGPLRGICRVPGDKSISHRALLFGALTDGVVEASGLGQGGDNLSTAAALRALGVDVQLQEGNARIVGVGFAGLRAAAEALDCGNSGTTIRLLLGLLAGRPFETEMRGDASLTRRPMGRVAAPLRRMGATIEGRSDPARPGDVYPPLRVRGGALVGIKHRLEVASAQLKSALVLAALQARGRSELTEPARSRDQIGIARIADFKPARRAAGNRDDSEMHVGIIGAGLRIAFRFIDRAHAEHVFVRIQRLPAAVELEIGDAFRIGRPPEGGGKIQFLGIDPIQAAVDQRGRAAGG